VTLDDDAEQVVDADRTFGAPWQARAFATTVALYESGAFGWDAFQRRLIEAVEVADVPEGELDEATYYRHWIAATASLLRDEGLLDEDELAERTAAFSAGDRDCHEFVKGDPHDVAGETYPHPEYVGDALPGDGRGHAHEHGQDG
jgi:nitrile hydratase accessory protein